MKHYFPFLNFLQENYGGNYQSAAKHFQTLANDLPQLLNQESPSLATFQEIHYTLVQVAAMFNQCHEQQQSG